MNYTDNPRKVYGRVEIIYSDADISKELDTTESGNSEISHPSEIYGTQLLPTVKACTMDGNSTMNGTFQMMGDGLTVGWWSGALSGTTGTFTTPPWIELHFIARPIISWVIVGDSKLNQYPVDFLIEYKKGTTTVENERITNNTKVQIRLTTQLEDITSIRMTIYKWNTPKACAKIMKFYDRLSEVYEGDAVEMFELSEEMASEDGCYNMNSDTLTVSIHNKDRKFDKGYLRSLMVLDRKLKPAIGIEKNGQIEYKQMGTFYSDEWQISQDSQWVKCSAVDKLMRLQDKTYVGYPLETDASLYDIAVDIMTKLGYNSEQYKISDSLSDVYIPMAYLPKESVWDALQEIANAGLCKIYVDRDDCIVIRAEDEETPTKQISINKSNLFTYQSSISLTDFANRISVDYCDVSIGEDLTEAISVELNLDPNAVLEITLDYTQDVAYPDITSSNPLVQLTDFQSGVNACTVKATNLTGTYQNTTLTVSGYALNITTKTITVQDDASVRDSGVTEYKHPTSELVQSYEQAEYIASVLLHKMHQGEGVVTTMWRGNPELELGDKYESKDRFDDESDLVCEYNKFTFDGGLKQETRGRKV